MSDATAKASETAEEPRLPVVPLPVPPAGDRRRTLLIAVAVLLALVAIGIAASLVLPGIDDWMFGELDPTSYDGVWWTGGGSYVVAQTIDAEGHPCAVVVDVRDGETRMARDAVVVAAEPFAARVWLAKDDGSSEFGPLALDMEGTPTPTLVWDVSAEDEPRRGSADWEPWPGPNGGIARLTVYPAIGALPSGLSFESSSDDSSVRAVMPQGLEMFEPIGWSPSGKYFAIADCTDDFPRPLIFSTETGRVVAERRGASSDLEHGAKAVWDAREDILYSIGLDVEGYDENAHTDRYYVEYLKPDGSQGEATELEGWKAPPPMERAWFITLIGAREEGGVVIGVELEENAELWSAGTAGCEKLETRDMSPTAALDPRGELAVLEFADGRHSLYVGPLDGTRKKVWEADERAQ